MPVYKIRLSRAKAETLHAQLRQHYHSQAGLLPLALRAARDLICITEEYSQGALEIRAERPHGVFRRFLSKDT